MNDREYLLIRGRLDRADDFTPQRCGSTFFVREWPRAEGSDVFVETVSADGAVLRSTAALLRSEQICAAGMQTWRVRAYVPLDSDAARVRLRRAERVVWEEQIPEAPTVRAVLRSPPSRGRGKRGSGREDATITPGFPGGKPALLTLRASKPAPNAQAHLTVVHRWSKRGFHTVYVGPMVQTLEIPADRMPGGRDCRLIAIYSNGMRSACAATEPFEVAPIGPVLRIVHPADGARFARGVPVTLEALVQDPEYPSAPQSADRLMWTLNGRGVAQGPLASIDPPPIGEHVIGLGYRVACADPKHRDPASTAPVMASMTLRIVVEAGGNDAVPANDWPEWMPFGQD